MVFNHELVNEILDAIFPLPDEFGVALSEDYDPEPSSLSSLEAAVHDIDEDASILFGMSKLVITSPNLENVVIKIPFNGYYDEYKEWNDFRWAPGSDPSDYCLAEYEKYRRLKTYRLDCFVAKIFHYKTISGVYVFIQEKVTPKCDLYFKYKASAKSQNLAKEWYKERKFDIDPEWIANCLDKYGKSKVERFLYYCANIDLDILEDAHSGNFGYRNNETPVILDYSNYLD